MRKTKEIFKNYAFKCDVKNNLIFLCLLLVFLLIRFYSIDTPGPAGDEIYVPYVALQAKLQVPSLHPPFVKVFGYKLPLGISPQSGGFPIYPQFILLHLTEHPFSHRILSVLYAGISVIFFYAFIRSFLNKKVALLSVLMLTFMPSHIFYSRTDPYFILRLTILSFMLHAFHKWYLNKDWKYFYAGCLATGLGLNTRLEMVMYVIAFPIYLIFFNRELLKDLAITIKKDLVKAKRGLVVFLFGGMFFILFNILSPRLILNFFRGESVLKEKNFFSAYLTNLVGRINHVKDYFNRGNPFGEIQGTFFTPVPFYIFLLFLSLVTSLIIVKRLRGRLDKRIEFLIVMPILILLQSAPSTSQGPFHNLIILPLLVFVLSYGMSLIPRLLSLFPALLMVILYINIDIKYYEGLKAGRENPLWSSAVFDLVGYLERGGVKRVLACDWGISRLIFYVSKGKIDTEEIFGYEETANSFLNKLREYKGNDNHYIFYCKGSTLNRIDAFRNFIRQEKIPYSEMFISNKHGEPIYAVYRLKGEK